MADKEFQHVTTTFVAWLAKIGVNMNPKMAIVDFRAEGRRRGVVAVEDFEEDETIFSIPRGSVLNINTVRLGERYRTLGVTKATLESMPSWLSLTIVMMCEASHIQSVWAPYFAVLPLELDALVFWTPEELLELQASAVISKIGRTKAEEIFHENIKILGANYLQTDLFHRMASTIMAYAFDIPEEEPQEESEEESRESLIPDEDHPTVLSMIPLADLLNADADRNNARLSCDSKDLEMRTIKPIQKGEEIFNDYGPLPRSDLLRRYGYVTDRYSPYDVIEISTDAIISSLSSGIFVSKIGRSIGPLAAPDLQERLDLANRENVFEDSYDLCHASAQGPCIPDELVALVYILFLNQETLHYLKVSSVPLSSRNKMCTELIGYVLAQLFSHRAGEYATTFEEDEKMIRSGACTPRKFAAVKVRQGEKAVLREAIQEAISFQGSNRHMRIDTEKRSTNEKASNTVKRSRLR